MPTDASTAILDAAESLFARHGFTPTTVKAIGREAGVNPALLYYYFPDKARLYRAVLERRIGAFAHDLPASLPAGLPARDGIRRLLEAYAGMMRAAPEFPRLMARELADHEAAHALPFIREIAAGLFQRLCDLIRAGQRRGEIRADVEPRFAAVSTVAQVAWFFVAMPAVSRLLGHEGRVPTKQIERFTDHAVRFALAALESDQSRKPVPARKRSPR